MSFKDTTKESILKAIEEFDSLGREKFLDKYGFGEATKYLLEYEGALYDSKAIVGVAHKFLEGKEPLTSETFRGGKKVVKHLESLGFKVIQR